MSATPAANWREFAACRGLNPEQFYDQKVEARAKEICRQCAVAEPCLAYALRREAKWGVFGGLSPSERRTLLKHLREGAGDSA